MDPFPRAKYILTQSLNVSDHESFRSICIAELYLRHPVHIFEVIAIPPRCPANKQRI